MNISSPSTAAPIRSLTGPDLEEGEPESCEYRDVQISAEREPGEEIFAKEFQHIHIIEIVT
jgi:hypothetical protein